MKQGVAHCTGCLPALSRILCKRPVNNLADWLRNVRSALLERDRWLFEDGTNGVVDAAMLAQVERQGPGQQTVRRHPNSVDVRLWLHVAKVAQLFRRHVSQGSCHLARHRHTAQ